MSAVVHNLDLKRRLAEGRAALIAADKAEGDFVSQSKRAAELAFSLNTVLTQAQIAEGFDCSQARVSYLLAWRKKGYEGDYRSNSRNYHARDKVPDPVKVERDRQILVRTEAGESSKDIAADLEISSRRVRKIIEKARGPAAPAPQQDWTPERIEAEIQRQVEERIGGVFKYHREREAVLQSWAENRAAWTPKQLKIIDRAIREPEAHVRELALAILDDAELRGRVCGVFKLPPWNPVW